MVDETWHVRVERRRRAIKAAAVFAACVALYHLNGGPHWGVDQMPPAYMAWSLVRSGSYDLQNYRDLDGLRGSFLTQQADGRWVTRQPPGTTWSALPFVAPIAAFHSETPALRRVMAYGKLIAAIYVAAAAALFYLLCLHLAPVAAVPATVLFAFGSTLWSTPRFRDS
jgi:hypothetical protein